VITTGEAERERDGEAEREYAASSDDRVGDADRDEAVADAEGVEDTDVGTADSDRVADTDSLADKERDADGERVAESVCGVDIDVDDAAELDESDVLGEGDGDGVPQPSVAGSAGSKVIRSRLTLSHQMCAAPDATTMSSKRATRLVTLHVLAVQSLRKQLHAEASMALPYAAAMYTKLMPPSHDDDESNDANPELTVQAPVPRCKCNSRRAHTMKSTVSHPR
jgi:hypothetical protein